MQRSNCNNQVCPKQQNDLNPQQRQQTTCSYPKQVPCNRRRRFGRLNDDVLDDFSSQYQDLIKSLPDYLGGEINVGPEIEAQRAYLSRKRRQIVDDSRVVMVQSQSSGRNSRTYCIRYCIRFRIVNRRYICQPVDFCVIFVDMYSMRAVLIVHGN